MSMTRIVAALRGAARWFVTQGTEVGWEIRSAF